MKRWFGLGLVLAASLVLGACATSSPDVIQRGDAQRMAQVEDAVVLSVRTVTVDGSQSGVGATVGGVVGAIGGYGGSGVQREAQVLGVLAGVAGAAVGNTLERMSTREEAVEVLVYRLRKKISETRAEIVTLRGLGYLLRAQPDPDKT